jgi:TM2 domain-containing membrane protein YozV
LCWAEKADNYSALCRAAASVNDNRARNREESSIIADFGGYRQLDRREKDALSGNLTDTATFPALNALLMSNSHKNKTFATFLAVILGAVGAHRFYLRGALDRLGLIHVTCLPITGLVVGLAPDANGFFTALPILVSAVAGFLQALILGLTSDEKFDAAFNAGTGKKSDSSWVLAVLLVVTMMIGTTTLIGTMARLFDLLSTGGAYG